MRILFFLLTCFLFSTITAQENQEALYEKWLEKPLTLLNQKKYDSVFNYFEITKNEWPKCFETIRFQMKGQCYMETGQYKKGEENYLKCLSTEACKDMPDFSQGIACSDLAEYYFDKKRYREALTYIELDNSKKYKRLNICQGVNSWYRSRLALANKKAACYEALGKTDSAAYQFIPLVFWNYEDTFTDSVEYELATLKFVQLVFKMQSKEVTQIELANAINHVHYQIHATTSPSSDQLFFSVECTLTFLNAVIDLSHCGTYHINKKEGISKELLSQYSKEQLLSDFRESPAYKYIMYGADMPIAVNFH